MLQSQEHKAKVLSAIFSLMFLVQVSWTRTLPPSPSPSSPSPPASRAVRHHENENNDRQTQISTKTGSDYQQLLDLYSDYDNVDDDNDDDEIAQDGPEGRVHPSHSSPSSTRHRYRFTRWAFPAGGVTDTEFRCPPGTRPHSSGDDRCVPEDDDDEY